MYNQITVTYLKYFASVTLLSVIDHLQGETTSITHKTITKTMLR